MEGGKVMYRQAVYVYFFCEVFGCKYNYFSILLHYKTQKREKQIFIPVWRRSNALKIV